MNRNTMEEQFLRSITEWSQGELDERLEHALDVYEEWSKDLTNIQVNQFEKLIEEFNYYTMKRIGNILFDLHGKAVAKYGISSQDTVVSVVRKKNGKLGSSSEYWLHYKFISGMSTDIFYDSLDEITANDWSNIKKIVFIDDCSGSGETFIKFLKRQKKNFSGKLIIFLTIEMMQDAENSINKFAQTNGLRIECLYHDLQDKALKRFSDLEVAEFIQLSKSREIDENDIRGYKNTEALMAFYNNTPNNTLGIFRCQTEKNVPLFPRKHEEKAGWKVCNKKRRNRKKQQYYAKVNGGNNGL